MFEQLLNNAQDILSILEDTVLEELRVLQEDESENIDMIRDILDDAEAINQLIWREGRAHTTPLPLSSQRRESRRKLFRNSSKSPTRFSRIF